jgi:hypothetical protein
VGGGGGMIAEEGGVGDRPGGARKLVVLG